MLLRARGSDSSVALRVPGRCLPAGEQPGRAGHDGGRVDEVMDEPLYRDRVCGIYIGKAGMAATIRVPSGKDPARRAQETRTSGTTRRGVLGLADWLGCW